MNDDEPKLTIELMMSDMREAGVFERVERRMKESQERARQIFGLPVVVDPTVTAGEGTVRMVNVGTEVSEMIERISRAMCQAAEERVAIELGEPGWKRLGYASQDQWVDEFWPNFADQARMAIEVMQEPTRHMLAAAQSARDRHSDYTASEIIYRAMIGAALKPARD